MANPIIKIKRGATAPTTLNNGELAVDLTNKNLYVGDLSGVPLAIGGEGTFAKKNASDVGFTGGNINGVTIGSTTAAGGAFTTLTASTAPTADNDVVRLKELNDSVSDLGSVFHYVGDVSSASTPLDLSTLSDTTTGAYYKVDVAGTYTAGASSFAAKVGDAFVKTTTGWQKLDNVDVEVLPTANEIVVTGDENAGYTVSIDPVFSGRVTTAESDINALETKTQNITATSDITTVAGVMQNGNGSNVVNFGTGSLTFTGAQEFGAVFVNVDLEVGGNTYIGTGVGGGNLEVGGTVLIEGNATFNGNIVGDGSTEITDCIIDGGVY
jgi:hypothetical protein